MYQLCPLISFLIVIDMLCFCYLVVEYFWRRKRAGVSYEGQAKSHVSSIVFSLAAASVLIILRNFYRDVELGEGFGGRLATVEPYFDCLDATVSISFST